MMEFTGNLVIGLLAVWIIMITLIYLVFPLLIFAGTVIETIIKSDAEELIMMTLVLVTMVLLIFGTSLLGNYIRGLV